MSKRVMMGVNGVFLETNPIACGMRLDLFKNQEQDFDIFEIQLVTHQQRIFKLNQYCINEKESRQKYQEILQELKGTLRRS